MFEVTEVIEIIEETSEALPQYEKVPISFRVESQLRVELVRQGLGGFTFIEEPVAPYAKDYDADETNKPSRWPEKWDVSSWGFLSAFRGGQRVGGAAVVWKTPEINLLEGRTDWACLWDLRVHPAYRGQSIGHQLFQRALHWARERECQRFLVETQNINVAACRFYARQGCELGAVHRYAYPDAANETQLLWYREA